MRRKPPSAHGTKVVWRITDAAPLGEIVRVEEQRKTAKPKPPEPCHHGGLFESSFDLLNGTVVIDSPDTLTPDLIDELFGPSSARGDARSQRRVEET